jgi:uncharacterized protein YdeI (YjbR/CyaY-like superfamily)
VKSPAAKSRPAANPTFFAKPAGFRAWLTKHHLTAGELLVGFHKKGSGKASITWPESVDQALCFGWIDGVRRRRDDTSYTIRFTPRRPGSIWSAINIARVTELNGLGLMHQAGLRAFAGRSEEKSRIYSYEQAYGAILDEEHQELLQANKKAWVFFQTLPPWYRRRAIHRIISAKKAETRIKRLNALIEDCARGRRD